MNKDEKNKLEFHDRMDMVVHNDRLNRFNSRQGHGFAAEQGNTLIDKVHGRDACIVGDDNAKNGADRVVDGRLIQTKYCNNAKASVEAAFKNGQLRYVDANGNAMQIEVPSDQYDEAVRIMAEKIRQGKVPGCTDPAQAKELVRKGNVTYKQAMNIAKAGTIESLTFDAANGLVVGAGAAGISGAVVMARALWDGRDLDEAVDMAVYAGIQAGGTAFVTSLISAQLVKTGLNQMLLEPSIALVKLLPSDVRHALVKVLRNGAPLYGGAATNNLAKLLRTNIMVDVVATLVLSGKDIGHFINGKISGRQLFKEMTTVASSVSGGTGGAYAGGAALSFLGPAGTIAGGILGGIVGGFLSSTYARKLLDKFIEDDAVALTKIVRDRFSVLAEDYLLSEAEADLIGDVLKICLTYGKLLEMYASDNRYEFADKIIIESIDSVICWRTRVIMPDRRILTERTGRVISGLESGTFSIREAAKANPQKIAEKLLGQPVSEFAAKKAWYVTQQFNSVGMQGETVLRQMQADEKNFSRYLIQRSMRSENGIADGGSPEAREFNRLLDELEGK